MLRKFLVVNKKRTLCSPEFDPFPLNTTRQDDFCSFLNFSLINQRFNVAIRWFHFSMSPHSPFLTLSLLLKESFLIHRVWQPKIDPFPPRPCPCPDKTFEICIPSQKHLEMYYIWRLLRFSIALKRGQHLFMTTREKNKQQKKKEKNGELKLTGTHKNERKRSKLLTALLLCLVTC